MNKRKQQSGFTLVEVLISLAILSLIMGVIMGGFRLGSRSWQKGEQRLEEQQRMRCVFSILVQDIKSCIKIHRNADPEASDNDRRRRQNQPVVFIGESDKLRFVTTASGISPHLKRGTLRLVSYCLSQEDDKPGLIMGECPLLYQYPFEAVCFDDEDSSGPKAFTYSLYPDVVEISFQYYGIKSIHGRVEEKGKEPEWHDDWNRLEDIQNQDKYLKNLPERIRMTMRRKQAEDDREVTTHLEIPVMVGERKE
jgi:prepilin-type N-terminal cleavage/methylation domain-containing protein